jgi:hypothetical protein
VDDHELPAAMRKYEWRSRAVDMLVPTHGHSISHLSLDLRLKQTQDVVDAVREQSDGRARRRGLAHMFLVGLISMSLTTAHAMDVPASTLTTVWRHQCAGS